MLLRNRPHLQIALVGAHARIVAPWTDRTDRNLSPRRKRGLRYAVQAAVVGVDDFLAEILEQLDFLVLAVAFRDSFLQHQAETNAVRVGEVEDVVRVDGPEVEVEIPLELVGRVAIEPVVLTVVINLRGRVRVPVEQVGVPTVLLQRARQIPAVVIRLSDKQHALASQLLERRP